MTRKTNKAKSKLPVKIKGKSISGYGSLPAFKIEILNTEWIRNKKEKEGKNKNGQPASPRPQENQVNFNKIIERLENHHK